MRVLKKLIFWGCIAAVGYGLLSYHFIFFGNSLAILKKSELTLNYTVFSTQGKTPESILSIDELRKDGIGQLMVQRGMISEKELERLKARIEEKKQAGS
ncbi:MAG: hypothetical protein AB1512_09950 [Thermodesulfobacteriota bacterium]